MAGAQGGSEWGRGPRASAPASARPGSPAPALEQPLGSSPSSGRRAAGGRPMGTPRAGWRHGPPTSELPSPAGAAGAARRSLLLPARRSGLAGALYRAHPRAHPLTPHPRGERRRRGRAQRGRPTCDTLPPSAGFRRRASCECVHRPGTVLGTGKLETVIGFKKPLPSGDVHSGGEATQ